MTTEIEFKFDVTASSLSALPEFILQFPVEKHDIFTLGNDYYDTPDCLLRQHRAGLRVRHCNNQHEMTLKIGGYSAGGLHQRQEFTVSLVKAAPDLSLLPSEALSPFAGQAIAEVSMIFSTNFQRERWVIPYQKSVIEMVCDRGEIIAGDNALPIQEIELELLSGETADLFDFANQLAALGGLRLSSDSKAARGYRLMSPEKTVKAPENILTVAPKSSVDQGFLAALTYLLRDWQHQELQCLSEKRLQPLEKIAGSFRELFTIWGGIMPRKATSVLREHLEWMEIQSKTRENAANLIDSSDYLRAKLRFLAWIFHQEWRDYVDEKHRAKWQGSFKRFADIQLARLSAALKTLFPASLTQIQYQDKSVKLAQIIAGLRLLSGAYLPQVTSVIDAWEALLQGIQKNQSLPVLNQLRQRALQSPIVDNNG